MESLNPVDLELDKLLKETPSLIERLQQEYNKFFSGAERKAPAVLREQLEKKIDRVRNLMRQAQSAAVRFRSQTTVAQYASYAAMWDKRMREREGV